MSNRSSHWLALAFGIGVLGGALAGSVNADERTLSPEEVQPLVDTLELLRGAVRYRVVDDDIMFAHSAPGLPADGVRFLERVREAIATEDRLPSFVEFERAFEMFEMLGVPVEDDPNAAVGITHRERRVCATRDEVVDRLDPYELEIDAGVVRTPSHLLVYQAENHQIELRNNFGNYIVRDPVQLMQPVPLSVTGLWYWRQFEWTELQPPNDGHGPLYRVRDVDVPEARLLLETSLAAPGLPLSCCLQNETNRVWFSSRYQYRSTGERAPVWLDTVYRIRSEENLVSFARVQLSEVEFDVKPEHLVLEVSPESRIWDFREPVTRFHGNQKEHWPPEAAQYLERLPDLTGAVGIIEPVDPTKEAPAPPAVEAPDPSWVRIALAGAAVAICGVWALLFRKRGGS